VTVCFAYVFIRGRPRPVGTAFFVGVPFEGTGGRFGCVVTTAMHLVAKARETADDGCLWLRVNTTEGGFRFIKIEDPAWAIPDQSQRAVDVAAAIWPHGRDIYDFKFNSIADVATPDLLESKVVAEGDEVFLPGLFVNHHGRLRNVPIVRVGNIASMPNEPVATKMLGAIDAYLVEARSVGGLSGSPVFLSMGVVRHSSRDANDNAIFHSGRNWYLLGIMHGHWDAEHEQIEGDALSSSEFVNMGIAVVTPIAKLVELLDSDPLKSQLLDMASRTRQALEAGTLPPVGQPPNRESPPGPVSLPQPETDADP
jgi:hypothetical protein